ncbi:MAG TPA: YeaH/YhbH family protein [Syntrophomonas sp.]|nr:YeaH/YhbH family protein [Syntrophomonas sp.]
MAIFREQDRGGRDRSAEDRRRHRQLVEEHIKRNLGNIIAEESIIGQSKGKTFKIPIRGLKEYQFVYGDNHPGVAGGKGDEKRGQRISEAQRSLPGSGDGAGNTEGEEIYETEITLEELADYLFEDLHLPFMEKKKLSLLETETASKRWGIQRKGIPPRLSKKRSMMERIKRMKSSQRQDEGEEENNGAGERFPFSEYDLRYQRLKEQKRPESNAVVICIMDNSGSMYMNKKFLARSFFFLLYQFVRYRYVNVELVFINHTTTALEVNEDEFFHRTESGGTMISSGYEKAIEIIYQRYSPEVWNIYAFHCSDGDNWPEDNDKAVARARELCTLCNLFGYGEIVSSWDSSESMSDLLSREIKADNFMAVKMSGKDHIWPAFKRFMNIAEGG